MAGRRRTWRCLLLASLLTLLPGSPRALAGDGVGRDDACPDAGAVDVEHHRVLLSLQLSPAQLSARGRIWLRARRATRTVVLDVDALRILRVDADDAPLALRRTSRQLCVRLPRTLEAGERVALNLAWQVPTDRAVPRFRPDQVWAGYRAAAWMPTLQDPAQRATLLLRIALPAGLRAVASGEAQPALRVGDRDVHVFSLSRPSPPFLYAFAAGRFAEVTRTVDGVTLRAVGRTGTDLTRALDVIAPMLRFASRKLGVALPSSTYTQVFVDGDAAQEAAGFALLSAPQPSGAGFRPTCARMRGRARAAKI